MTTSPRTTVTRLATVAISALIAVPALALVTAGAAHADDNSGPTHVDFGWDEGSSFTVWDNGNVSVGTGSQDAITSEGAPPTSLGDVVQALLKDLTGWDLPYVPSSWIVDKVIDGLDGLIQVTPATGDDTPAPTGDPVDGGVPSGGVSTTGQAQPQSGSGSGGDGTGTGTGDTVIDGGGVGDGSGSDTTTQDTQTDEDCPLCPTAAALPNPDGDGPSGPAYDDPRDRIAQPTDDGTGPVGPASTDLNGLGAIAAGG